MVSPKNYKELPNVNQKKNKNITTQPEERVWQLTLSSLVTSGVRFGPLARSALSLVPPDPELGLRSAIH